MRLILISTLLVFLCLQCEANSDIKVDIDYPRCVSNAMYDPSRLPTMVDDRSYFKMCWDHRTVHITCHSQFMIVTPTQDYCIVPGAKHEGKSASELGLMD